jgi:Chalcone isomerase-like
MTFTRLAAVALITLASGSSFAADLVDVPGSRDVKYPSEVTGNLGGKSVTMRLTGTAMRTKYVLNVYAIASYVQQGVAVNGAEAIASADCYKRLHLVMERNVEGKDMAEAFRTAIRANHPEGFDDEVAMLVQLMRANVARKGDHIGLTHLPGVGLHVAMPGKADFVIKNPKFSRAVWDIYLGKHNVGEAVKKGLTSRL